MGCDIHDFAEIRQRKGRWAGKWTLIEKAFPDPFYRPDDPLTEWNYPVRDAPYGACSYRTFAVLAGVRNEADMTPIAKPKGLPSDVSKKVNKYAQKWGSDGHSHSWLNLLEILSYPWTTEYTHSGVVSEEEYRIWQKEGRPSQWYKNIGGGNTVNVTHEFMQRLIDDDEVREGDSKYCALVTWKETAAQSCHDFLKRTVPDLLRFLDESEEAEMFLTPIIEGDTVAMNALRDWLEERGLPGLDDIRMVFFFDN